MLHDLNVNLLTPVQTHKGNIYYMSKWTWTGRKNTPGERPQAKQTQT